MTIFFGNDFDGPVHTPDAPARAGAAYMGPRKLLHWLEQQLGLGGNPDNTEYLRIELYRQALRQWLGDSPTPPFYAASFEADRFATAATLLTWRDELLLAGWDFQHSDALPERLAVFARVEPFFGAKVNAPELSAVAQGYADRFHQVLECLPHAKLPLQKIAFFEEIALQKPHIQRFVHVLLQKGIDLKIENISAADAAPNARFSPISSSGTARPDAQGTDDETRPGERLGVAILKSRRDGDAATYLAQIIRENKAFRPFFLVPEMSLLLEQALVQEGLPALGILSASLARPSLQVLKLAPAFLWEPLDVFKIMEFVTLPLKPLDTGLALEIARVLAEKPGLNSDKWFATVYGYLERAEVPDEAREQYQFWFNRRRYASDATAPKREVIAIYRHLREWALEMSEKDDASAKMMLLLAEQARRIAELLDTLPEARIGFLELERIVRTIYEPSPVTFQVAEAGSFGYVHQPGAIAAPVDTLIWWNCLYTHSAPPPDKWQEDERQFFDHHQLIVQKPADLSRLNLLLQQRAILQTRRQLILVVPEQADGTEAVPGLILGDIEAAVKAYKSLVFHLDKAADRERLSRIFALPQPADVPVRAQQRGVPYLHFAQPEQIAESEYETPTNLESLFYYPHRWFFKQKLRLYSSSLLSVSHDATLLGNLAHRFFEILLLDPNLPLFDRKNLHEWVDQQAVQLLEKEGATLLLYGREPEKKSFLAKVKNAAWSLVSILRNNGWQVLETEKPLDGYFGEVPVRGKADLVLARNAELAIVDLKWSGANRRKELIINQEDLQLVLYAKLLPPAEHWPHTAYFIIEDGKIIARNNAAFKEAMVAGQHEDHGAVCEQIYKKMEHTFRWRLDQIKRGMVEIRTARTAAELDALYAEQLFDLLEMKNEDSRWDEYRVLV